MKIKKNISVQDRIDFVNFVVNTCEVDGKHCHALFDFVWRTAVITWFVDPEDEEAIHVDGVDQDEICDFVYSDKGIDIVNDPDIAEVLSGLYEACEKEINDRREEYMIMYKELVKTDPMDRIAVAFEKIAQTIGEFNDPKIIAEIAKQAGLTGRKTKTKKGKAIPKPPIKLDFEKKE